MLCFLRKEFGSSSSSTHQHKLVVKMNVWSLNGYNVRFPSTSLSTYYLASGRTFDPFHHPPPPPLFQRRFSLCCLFSLPTASWLLGCSTISSSRIRAHWQLLPPTSCVMLYVYTPFSWVEIERPAFEFRSWTRFVFITAHLRNHDLKKEGKRKKKKEERRRCFT